jgi:hypothetical protein
VEKDNMSILYPPVIDQIFYDNEGNPLANGFVRAFYHGTTDHAQTYNRNDEPNEWPIQLDASGRAQFKLSTDVAYDVQTYDMNDALIKTMPNVRLQNGGGSSSAPFDLVGMGLEISGDSPDRTLQITSAYDAGLVHKDGSETITGFKDFTEGIKSSSVNSAFDFTTLTPQQGAQIQRVTDSSGSGDQISMGVLSNADGKTHLSLSVTQRGTSNQIMMTDLGRFGSTLNEDLDIDPFVLQSELDTEYMKLEACDAMRDPTGWVNQESITTTYDPATRTVSLTTTEQTLKVCVNGVIHDLGSNTFTSSAHADTAGVYYLYSVDGVTFSWSTSLWEFYNIQVVSVLYASATKAIALNEVHGVGSWNYHRTSHWAIGTIRDNATTPQGGTIGGYVLGSTTEANRRPSATAVNLLDEDLRTVISALPDGGPYSHLFLSSGTATDYNLGTELEIVKMSGTTPQIQNPTTGAWVNLGTAKFANVYLIALPACSGLVSQKGRWLWMQGQAEYASISAAQGEQFNFLNKANISSLFAEFLPVAKVTIKRGVSYFSIEQVEFLSTSRAASSGIVYVTKNNLKTYIETSQQNGQYSANLLTSDGVFFTNAVGLGLTVDFADAVFAKDYTVFINNLSNAITITKTGVTFYNGSTSSLNEFFLSANNVATEIVLKFVSSTVCFVSVNQ